MLKDFRTISFYTMIIQKNKKISIKKSQFQIFETGFFLLDSLFYKFTFTPKPNISLI